jgi:hypothetical protein
MQVTVEFGDKLGELLDTVSGAGASIQQRYSKWQTTAAAAAVLVPARECGQLREESSIDS